ncbi:MAG: Minichromosome maintenance protein MCM [Methanomethylovorans sp. PtaU1.Bin073]|nr:MAG: Minichromosome maintenance protein MCM [Methanomethylovorans sp. PtaU1.Bin073]
MNNDTTTDLVAFLKLYYWDDILELANNFPDKDSLIINYSDIETYNSGSLVPQFKESPTTFLESLNEALRIIDLPIDVELKSATVRVHNFPVRTQISDIRSEHINKFIAVEGIISQITSVKPRAIKIVLQCMRCETTMEIYQSGPKLVLPQFCDNENCGKKGPFKEMVEQFEFINTQDVLIQDPPESLKGKTNPDNLKIELEGNLVGKLNAGDRVIFNGVIGVLPIIGRDGKTPYFEFVLRVNSFEKLVEDYEEIIITDEDIQLINEYAQDPDIFEKLILSIAPAIKGYDNIKEALVLQLFGGTSKILNDSTRIRGESHIMFVGDPGVAKSQLLRKMVEFAPRGILASGKGSSTAGLTATATKDESGRWTLQAGALVLADGGLAAIDEMDKMSKEDQSAFHEAMEQQTVTITKAGINTTLRSRCAILGAANPKYGRFDRYESVMSQVTLPPALMSRFDLIFLMLDIPDEKKDSEISMHILQSHQAGIDRKIIDSKMAFNGEVENIKNTATPVIEPEFIKKYVAYCRKHVIPRIPDNVLKILQDFYLDMRRSSSKSQNNPVPVTARQLEGLIRLTEASARIRLREFAQEDDARRTIRLTLASMDQVYKDPTTGMYDSDIITTGTSKSQREKIQILKNVILNLGTTKVSKERILEEMKLKGFDEKITEELIQKMRQKGDILSPSHDTITLVT